jgi:hypothetical protein
MTMRQTPTRRGGLSTLRQPFIHLNPIRIQLYLSSIREQHCGHIPRSGLYPDPGSSPFRTTQNLHTGFEFKRMSLRSILYNKNNETNSHTPRGFVDFKGAL